MSDFNCGCCNDSTEQTETAGATANWISGPDPMEALLPEELQVTLGRFLGEGRIRTLADWAVHLRRQLDGAIEIDDLCHTEKPSQHWGVWNGQRHYFTCFYDAVILAALVDEPIDIRTQSPKGETITATAVGDEELTVDPDSAVFSFGIDNAVEEPSGDGPSLQAGYSAICPYVQAFTNRESYQEWALQVPAATVSMPLDGATALADHLAR